jgi:hypothetical protein
MSEKYQQFQAFLVTLKSKLSENSAGVYLAAKSCILLKVGVVLVSQRDVRNIDYAINQLKIAQQAIQSAEGALRYFEPLRLQDLRDARGVVDDYAQVLADVVNKAYARRMAAVSEREVA